MFHEIIQKLTDKGIIIIAAAGNQGETVSFFPAAYEEVISVGAYDQQHKKATFSNYGSRVDIMAPGVDLIAPGLNHDYLFTEGTSEAAPIVAGTFALLLQQTDSIDRWDEYLTDS